MLHKQYLDEYPTLSCWVLNVLFDTQTYPIEQYELGSRAKHFMLNAWNVFYHIWIKRSNND